MTDTDDNGSEEFEFTFQVDVAVQRDGWGYSYDLTDRWDLVDGPDEVPGRILSLIWAEYLTDLRDLGVEVEDDASRSMMEHLDE